MENPDDDKLEPSLRQVKREWAKKLHLFNAQELELYNQLDDMVPFSQVLAEIDDLFGPGGSANK